tara:strand:- start:8076 stop:8294 length:219 start_codon:yes stop_codon:yes gene_type:complete
MVKDMEKLWELLEKHDWYYTYSDDHRYYVKGSDERKAIQAMCQENGSMLRLYEDYAHYIFNKTEKPELENYG